MSYHYESSELLDYERGLLSGDEAQRLFAHCQGCLTCGPRLAMVLALRQRNRRRLVVRRNLVAMAAAIVIAVATGLTVLLSLGTGNVGPDTIAEGESADSPPNLADYASTELPRPGFLRIRFGDALPVTADETPFRLKAAVEALWAGDVESSLPVFRDLRSHNPDDPEVAAYLGISLYVSGNNDPETGNLLEEGTNAPWYTLGRYSIFYLANYCLRTGQGARGIELLSDLAAGQDSPARAARRLLEQIPAGIGGAR